MNAANMVRSLLPLVLICLAIVWWTNFRQGPDVQPVRTVDVGGQPWTRSTTENEETALSREVDGVIVLVSGSASDEELEAVAAAVEPYDG